MSLVGLGRNQANLSPWFEPWSPSCGGCFFDLPISGAPPLGVPGSGQAAHPDLANTVTVHPICQEKLYNPGRDVSINPNENPILTP